MAAAAVDAAAATAAAESSTPRKPNGEKCLVKYESMNGAKRLFYEDASMPFSEFKKKHGGLLWAISRDGTLFVVHDGDHVPIGALAADYMITERSLEHRTDSLFGMPTVFETMEESGEFPLFKKTEEMKKKYKKAAINTPLKPDGQEESAAAFVGGFQSPPRPMYAFGSSPDHFGFGSATRRPTRQDMRGFGRGVSVGFGSSQSPNLGGFNTSASEGDSPMS